MTYRYTDFSEYTTGNQPTGWTSRWYSSVSYYVEDITSATGGKVLTESIPSALTYWRLLSWDAASAEDVDVVCRMKSSRKCREATEYSVMGVAIRASGTYSAYNMYGCTIRSSSSTSKARLFKAVAGSATSLSEIDFSWEADVYYWMRLSAVGTSIRAKVWSGDRADEPATWTFDETDADVSGSGYVGPVSYWGDYNTLFFDVFEVDPPDVQHSAHTLTSDNIDSMTITLSPANAFHVHSVPGINSTIVVQSSYHAHVAENTTISKSVLGTFAADCTLPDLEMTGLFGYNMTTEQADGTHLILPTLESSGGFGTRLNLSKTLPGVSLSAQFGLRTKENLNFPTIESSGTILTGRTLSLSKRLPSIAATGQFGIRAGTLTLPVLEIVSSMLMGGSLSLAKNLPVLGSDGSFGLRSKNLVLPSVSIDADMSGETLMSLSKKLPTIEGDGKFGFRSATLKLPTLESDAAMSGTGVMSLAKKLPVVTGTGSFGMRAGLKLPSLSCEGTVTAGGVFSLSKNLPAGTVSGQFGMRAGTLRLPSISSDATILGNAFSLTRTLPGIQIEAEFVETGRMSLGKDFPAIQLSAGMVAHGTLTLDGKVAALRLAGSLLAGGVMSLDGDLPCLEVDVDFLYGSIMEVDGTLPPLVSGYMLGSVSKMSKTSRFDGYVLRHVR